MVTKIFGHRGYPARFAENSLEGFRYVSSHGIDGIETDVQRTADGHLVIIHDETIDRTTDGTGYVKDMNLAELQSFHQANGEPIPTLQQFMDSLGHWHGEINIEFKTGKVRYAGIEQATQKAVEEAGRTDEVVYSSFNPDSLVALHAVAPHQPVALLAKTADPERLANLGDVLSALHLEECTKNAVLPERIWTVNDPWQMRALFQEPKVVGIITDKFEEAVALRSRQNVRQTA
ncbi:MAG: glycerophosphodiester phosphodiesterase family protein [Schleiferilactobacillus perolens]|jgi:glycerophosphoryl diester phosphodiesterase|uniref:Glycerophosphoryl diester phosphodiesterase n=1 Tax=Schleiferilactobacillus perolens DSM 12744 TaxID=1423792 RepID=A0A0R1MVH8_9LACO|nr:glycerophosphodiester phosphodiesterase family protein [Schleiferilactobacillus perolens]KRL12285.1 glycerophosphoryl diester phosphodiesterase [Schleiferilactobacillus perolens DSM 12744]MCI1891233.1 glycerophosphodiester phosphodiesterase [Schleiferilactobacillus harbinensis]MCI1911829.1 glycerophosphodiester phosphodiesterase [Schleiferilactobacillus harbinensis]